MGLKMAWGIKKDSSLNKKKAKNKKAVIFLDIPYITREFQPETAGP